MDVLERVEQDFIARRDSGALARALPGWRARHHGLRRFPAIEALVAACRNEEQGSWEAADSVLSSLCEEATSGDESAGILLLWLLLPGLLLARSRLAPIGVFAPEELTSEMLAGLWEEATKVRADARRVAARLVNSARFRGLAAIREAIDWAGRREPLVGDPADWGPPGEYSLVDEEPDGLPAALREGVLSPEQAALVLAGRQAIRELSEKLGISLLTAQKRRHRARGRLRAWMERT